MKRRIIKQGNNTLTITLPRKWAQKFDVKPGEELEVEENESFLKIYHGKAKSQNDIEINIPKADQYLRRYLNIPYCLGYDEIKITFHDSKVLDHIQNNLEKLLGFEIIDQGNNYCLIKNVAKGLDNEFKNMLNRLMLVSITMLKDLNTVLDKNELNNIESIISMEGLTNKLSYFCRRMLNTKGYEDHKKKCDVYYITCLIEEIADDCKDICVYILKNKLKPSKEVRGTINSIIEQYQLIYHLFYKFDRLELAQFKENRKQLLEDITLLFDKLPKKELTILSSLKDIVNKQHHISNVLS